MAVSNATARRPLRVLIVEDSEDDAELVLLALRREGYDAHHRRVDDAAAMRAALREESWDLILSDHQMPRFSAREALAIFHESGLDLPFILVSGSIGEEQAASAMKAGAHDFFLKDRLARLGSAIDRELREAEVRRERRQAMERLRQSEQELRRAVEVRNEFLAIASHELRTPLTPLTLQLQSALRLLRKRADNDAELTQLGSSLEGCKRYVDRFAVMVGNLLDVTRIASGRLILERSSFDLRRVVGTVARRLKETLRAAEMHVEPGEAVIGSWDEAGVESVVTNLLTNAIRYGQGKPIDVRVERRGDRARLAVTDRGMGIALEEQERIFGRFERAVPVEHFGGFGLGLWVARQIVEAHQGTISVESEAGKGSTFVVELPLSPDAAGEG